MTMIPALASHLKAVYDEWAADTGDLSAAKVQGKEAYVLFKGKAIIGRIERVVLPRSPSAHPEAGPDVKWVGLLDDGTRSRPFSMLTQVTAWADGYLTPRKGSEG